MGEGAGSGRQLRDVGRGHAGSADGTARVGTEFLGADVVPGRARWGEGFSSAASRGSGCPRCRVGGGLAGPRGAGLGAANRWRQRVGFGSHLAGVWPAGILRAWSFQQEPGRVICLCTSPNKGPNQNEEFSETLVECLEV